MESLTPVRLQDKIDSMHINQAGRLIENEPSRSAKERRQCLSFEPDFGDFAAGLYVERATSYEIG